MIRRWSLYYSWQLDLQRFSLGFGPNLQLYGNKGDDVTVSLSVSNDWWTSAVSHSTFRASTIPASVSDMQVSEVSDGVTLNWLEPQDHGTGDRLSSINFVLNISTCGGVTSAHRCTFHMLTTNASKSAAGRYVAAVSKDLTPLAAEYQFKVFAVNHVGMSLPATFSLDVGLIPVIMSPSGALHLMLPAADSASFHIWAGASKLHQLVVNIANLPQQLLPDLSASASLTINGATSTVQLSAAGTQKRSRELTVDLFGAIERIRDCILERSRCSGSLDLQLVEQPWKRLSMAVTTMVYPAPQLQAVYAAKGPEGGGRMMRLVLVDYQGPRTRQAAGLANLLDSESTDLAVTFACGGFEESAKYVELADSQVAVAPGVAAFDGFSSVARDLLVLVPPSPCPAPAEAQVTVLLSESNLFPDVVSSLLKYEYVGMFMESIAPGSGISCPGSGGVELTIILSNAGSSLGDLNISIAGFAVGLASAPKPGAGDRMVITVMTPELPLALQGPVDIVIRLSGGRLLQSVWQYISPPTPAINKKTFTVDGFQKRWMRQGPGESILRFTVSNLLTKYGWNFDSLDVSIQGQMAISVEHVRVASSVEVRAVVSRPIVTGSFNLRLHVRKGSSEVGVVEVFDDQTQSSEPSFCVVEVRDTGAPSLISFTPTEGPLTRGTLIALGLTGAAAFLEDTSQVACVARTASGTYTPVIEAFVPLNDWLNQGAVYHESMVRSKLWAFMATSSQALVGAYASVVSDTSKTANAMYSDDPEAMVMSAIVVIRSPVDVTASQMSVFELTPPDGGRAVSFNFSFVADHPGPAEVVRKSIDSGAVSEDGHLAGGLGGGNMLSVTIAKFPIVFQATELVAMFGRRFWYVSKLIKSDSLETSIVIQIPPSDDEGDVMVQIFSSTMASNRATLTFNYYDDRFPKILHFTPTTVYEEGGEQVTIFMSNFPLVKDKADASVVLSWGEQEPVSVPLLSMTQGSSGVVVATLAFDTPSMAAGDVFMVVRANNKESDPVTLVCVGVPTTPPIVNSVNRAGQTTCTGAETVTVTLGGLRMVKTAAELLVLAGNIEVTSDSFIMVSSTTESTMMSFVIPASDPGPLSLQISARSMPALVGSISLQCADPYAVRLAFVSPSWVYSGQSTQVVVGIKYFGDVSSVADVTVAADSAQITAQVVAVIPAGSNEVTEIELSTISPVVGALNLTLRTSTKTVRFELRILDNGSPRVRAFAPQSSRIYGGSLITVTVDNWPTSAVKMGRLVLDGMNATLTALSSQETGVARFSAIIPSVPFPRSVSPVLHLPQAVPGYLEFPAAFTYVSAPAPTIEHVAPARAPTGAGDATRIQAHLADLAPVSASSELAIVFQSSTGTQYEGQVLSWKSAAAKGGGNSRPKLIVDFLTPIWQEAAEMSNLLAYHRQFPDKIAQISFEWYDVSEPRLDRMEREDPVSGLVQGQTSLEVPMSSPSQARILVNTVSEMAAPSIKVGDSQIDVTFSSWNSSAETAELVFTVPVSQTAGQVYGLVSFGGSFTPGCSTDCCARKSCAACGRGIVCFTLAYFDDSQPGVVLLSESAGPDVGGHVIVVQLIRFPMVSSAKELSAQFQVAGVPVFAQALMLDYSAPDDTVVQIEAPAVSISGAAQLIVDVNINGPVSVSFKYRYEATAPFAGVPQPSVAPESGGITIYVTLHYFAYPTPVQVVFGSTELAKSSVRIHQPSGVQATRLSFDVPADPPLGVVEVSISPKGCSEPCSDKVFFNIEVRDEQLPELVQPIPSSVALTASTLPPVLVDKLATDSRVSYSLVLVSTGTSLSSASTDAGRESRTNGLTALSIPMPADIEASEYTVQFEIEAADTGSVHTLSFALQVYDPNQIRLVSCSPSELPTAVSVGGKFLHSLYTVTIVCSNCPLGRPKSAYSVSVGLEKAAVVSIDEVSSCAGGAVRSDCVLTQITIKAPILSAPEEAVEVRVQVKGTSGAVQEAVAPALRYTAACNYDDFCGSDKPDMFQLQQDPLAALQCDMGMCVLSANIPDAVIVSASPSTGSELGGTQVTLRVSNFPAFDSSDVAFSVKDGTMESRGHLLSLSVAAGSTLASGVDSVLLLQTPSRPGTSYRVTMSVKCSIAGISRTVFFSFKYERDISGPATILTFSPKTMYVSEPLEVAVTLGNFPTMSLPYDTEQVQVSISSTGATGDLVPTAKCSSVAGSSDESTSVLISRPVLAQGWPLGSMKLKVFWKDSGEAASGEVSISVIPDPTATATSSYPTEGSCSDSTVVEVLLAHLEPTASASWIQASLVDADTRGNLLSVEVVGVKFESDSSCSTTICSLAKVQISVGPFPTCSPGAKTIAMTVALQDPVAHAQAPRESVDVEFHLRAPKSPRVQGISPPALIIGDETVRVTLFLLDFPSCGAVCDKEQVSVIMDGGTAEVEEMVELDGSMLRLKVVPPTIKPGKAPCTVEFQERSASWKILAIAPQPKVVPVDGLLAGGLEVVVTAAAKGVLQDDGRYDVVSAVFDYSAGPYVVAVDGVDVPVISHSLEQMGPLLMVSVKVNAPAASTPGYVWYSLSIAPDQGSPIELATLAYEYYGVPIIASALPSSSLDIGVSNAADGKSTRLMIENFPSTVSPADFLVSFGAVECDGTLCGILGIDAAKGFSVITVTVPRLPAGKAVVKVEYVGAPLPPLGREGTDFVRTKRAAEFPNFQVFAAALGISSIAFCSSCGAKQCVSRSGVCGDGAKSLSARVPSAEPGFLIISLNNADVVRTGNAAAPFAQVSATAFFPGTAFLTFKQTLFTDSARGGEIALEFEVPAMQAVGKVTGSLEVTTPVRALPIALSFQVDFFDSSISVACVGEGGCRGPASGAMALSVRVANLLPSIPDGPISNIITVSFGSLAPTSVTLDSADSGVVILSVVPPACDSCSFSNGVATVRMTIALRSDPTIAVSEMYNYWRAPRIVSAALGARGTTVLVSMDQAVQRVGGVLTGDRECPVLFGAQTLNSLGAAPRCSWTGSASLQIDLGTRPSVVPDSLLTFKAGVMATANGIAANQQMSVQVAVPEFPQPPTVELDGPSTIDMCSPLALTAAASSSRDVIFSWACYDSNVLHALLQTQNTSALIFPAGTPEMAADTFYTFAVTVTDYLGIQSEPATVRLYKQRAPAPILTFSPAMASVFSSDEVSVSAGLEFSSCAGSQGQMSYAWSQVDGPPIAERYLLGTSSQLFIPADTLLGGRDYVVALTATFVADPSQSVQSNVRIEVKGSPLQANIAGGSGMEVSSSSAVRICSDSLRATQPMMCKLD